MVWDIGRINAAADQLTTEEMTEGTTEEEMTEEGTTTEEEMTQEIETDADRLPDDAAAEVTPERMNAVKVAASCARKEAILRRTVPKAEGVITETLEIVDLMTDAETMAMAVEKHLTAVAILVVDRLHATVAVSTIGPLRVRTIVPATEVLLPVIMTVTVGAPLASICERRYQYV